LGRSRNFSEEVGAKIDVEVRKLIDNAYNKALQLLSDNRHKLNAVAEALLEKEKLEALDFETIFENA